MRSLTRLAALIAVFGVIIAGCGSDDSPTGAGDITVFAAASLTEAFTAIGEAFEDANPDASVTFNFAASSTLARQINEGAPADIFASADPTNMRLLVDAGNAVGEPEVFATNRLQIITEPGNPKGITSVADLADPDLTVLTCGPEVPIGRYSNEVLENAGVTVTSKSYESDVKAIVTKVTLGEADAGIVYASDVAAAGPTATGVDIPDNVNVVATYPIAITKTSTKVDTARAFIDFVQGDEGQAILAVHGFTGA